MDPTLSVSKGIFVFKNGATRATNTARKSNKSTVSPIGLFGSEVTHQPFYATYTAIWRNLQKDIEELQKKNSTRVLKELVDYVMQETTGNADNFDMDEILPTAALLTGVNQPDHLKQFSMISRSVREHMAARVCILEARDCSTLKAIIEGMVYKLIEHENIYDNDDGDDEDEERDHRRLRRSQCTIKQLQRWYRNNFCPHENNEESDIDLDGAIKRQKYTTPALVVILPDFECFSVPVLQDFIIMLSAQRTRLPFVLVLGVATSVSAVHHTLAYHVTSKIKLRLFQTQSSSVELNEIVEKVILSPKYVFHLSGTAFKLLTHIFLYYDFSINGFIQGFKYCLMEHFFQGNAYSLCTSYAAALEYLKTMTNSELETIRRLLSFRPYVESLVDCKSIIDILTNDDYLLKKLPSLLFDCHSYLLLFRTFLEFLLVLVEDLPKCPLGKYRRELYALCLSREICEEPEFKESWHMLSFLSKDEFVKKMHRAIKSTETFVNVELLSDELGTHCALIANEILTATKSLLQKVIVAGLETQTSPTTAATNSDNNTTTKDGVKTITSRQELKERLLQMSKERAQKTDFSKAVANILNFIQNEIVQNFLRPLKRAPPLHEIFIFNNVDTVRRHIIGAPRGALHMALTNPHHYLQCNCCKLREYSELLPTMPDISVAYKLHLECGRLINLYDWLQAFRTVVEPQAVGETDADTDEVDPEIQARFTRAVAELQFLGFIKMSKRKRDHVQRLTW